MAWYIDGGCSGNGQRDIQARRMIAVVTDDAGVVLSEHEKAGGSNNIAELIAVRDALALAHRLEIPSVELRTDSRNNFAWVFGKIGKDLNDRATVVVLRKEIQDLRQTVELQLVWVPREDNIAGHYIEKRYAL